MNLIRLKGLSQKGKNRIRELGSEWIVHTQVDRVLFNPELGPWLMVSPVGTDMDHKSSRWVHATQDKDFTIEEP